MSTLAPHPDAVIWLDNRMVPWAEATTHVLTHSLHYGSGVFEGLRAFATEQGPAIFRLQEHTDRLFASADCVGMTIPYSKEEINQACIDSVQKNQLETAYVRPICFYGAEGLGLHAKGLQVHAAVAAWEWGVYLGAEGLEQGIRVYTSSIIRDRVNAPLTSSKICGNYVYSAVATAQAKQAGYDEALLLEADGRISEGSGENLFVVRDGVLETPALGSALDGITRRTIIELARETNLEVRENRLVRDDLLHCEEAFFTGTAAEVTPIRELDGEAIGNGRRGPITTQLQQQYQDIVSGRSERHLHWLTFVH
ncbi:MAG: branched-chain amino acid transaminase [Gammaproteobacteria bacterium]|nr:branched-chain amino acid transaminase [Gammaproteobacteria bacterium]